MHRICAAVCETTKTDSLAERKRFEPSVPCGNAGDVVHLYNDHGACLAGAVLSAALPPGIVQLSTGAWYAGHRGDGRDKSCQPTQLRRYHGGSDNRPKKEPGSRRASFLKTAPIINGPV